MTKRETSKFVYPVIVLPLLNNNGDTLADYGRARLVSSDRDPKSDIFLSTYRPNE